MWASVSRWPGSDALGGELMTRRTSQRSGGRRGAPKVAELRIVLEDTDPAIWRRIAVAYDTPLAVLHRIFVVAMGWRGYHLHQFDVGDATFGVPNEDFPTDTISEDGVTLRAIAPAVGATFVYEYDFGDNWRHLVTLERLQQFGPSTVVPYCLDGARACPPEDVGGISGYEEMLEVLTTARQQRPGDTWADEEEEEEEEDYGENTPASYRRWLGYEFDPDAFHRHCVNMELYRLVAFDPEFQALLPRR